MMYIVLLTPFITMVTKAQVQGHPDTKEQSGVSGFRAQKLHLFLVIFLCQSSPVRGKIMIYTFSLSLGQVA